jgi:hypothetical protein
MNGWILWIIVGPKGEEPVVLAFEFLWDRFLEFWDGI